MKAKKFITIIIVCLGISFTAYGQKGTDYSVEIVSAHPSGQSGEIKSFSSTYWYGDTYYFDWYKSQEFFNMWFQLETSTIQFDDEGHVENSYLGGLMSQEELYYSPHVSSCVFHNELFVIFFKKYNDDSRLQNAIGFYNKSNKTEFLGNSFDIDYETDRQMATVAVNDTLYIFFVDHADGIIKYFRGTYKERPNQYEAPQIELVSNTATVLSNSLKPHGNVSACSYADNNNKEKIMVAFAGEVTNSQNEINIFSGIQDHFEIFKQIVSPSGKPAKNIAIAQGSVKGGEKQGYYFQLGYSFQDEMENKGPYRCEFNYDTGEASDWERTSIPDAQYASQELTGFMTYYNKSSFKREKHLYLMFPSAYIPEVWAIQWPSDKLIYDTYIEQVPPITNASDFFDLILVVEGAPPYALNGWTLGDQNTNINYPSEFNFVKSNETTITAQTKYTQSAEMNMGFGPVTAGFKMSFLEGSGSSYSKSVSIQNPIHPPLADNDSAGQMFYYYIAPTVKREQWNLCDYDGNTLTHARNLFFFSMEDPQLKRIPYNMIHFSDSPRAYDLSSYVGRNVEGMSGMEQIMRKEIDLDIAAGGGGGTMDMTFSNTQSHESDMSFAVSLGIDAEGEIFSASAEAEVGFEYERSTETKCEKTFELSWDNPPPVDQTDTTDIKSYTAIAYIMKTTANSAYYLMDGFKDYRPFFITYEVQNIEYGAFGQQGIDEVNAEKYKVITYPNPCTDHLIINYNLQKSCIVEFYMYNSLGKLCCNPVSKSQSVGNQQIQIITSNLPQGIYFYKMIIDNDLVRGKIVKE